MFVREVFHGEAKTQGELMIDNIRNAFKNNLKNLDWMDSETRKAAEVKADAITDMIGKEIKESIPFNTFGVPMQIDFTKSFAQVCFNFEDCLKLCT